MGHLFELDLFRYGLSLNGKPVIRKILLDKGQPGRINEAAVGFREFNISMYRLAY
jgi:hypothetical protein